LAKYLVGIYLLYFKREQLPSSLAIEKTDFHMFLQHAKIPKVLLIFRRKIPKVFLILINPLILRSQQIRVLN
jgi:hypothetical protein